MAYNPSGAAPAPAGSRPGDVFSLETFEAAVDLVTNPPRADAGPEAAAAVARATAYIQQLSAHPQAHIVVLQVLMSAKKAETRFFCFQALESYVSSRAYAALGVAGRTEVRQALLHWLASRGGGDPLHNLLAQEAKYVRGKLAVVLGYLVKFDYPEVWPSAFGDLLAACTATTKGLTSPTPGSGPAGSVGPGLAFSGLDLFLQVLGVVDTEVADPHINRPKAELDHNMLVKDQMRATAVMGNLVDHWLSLLLQFGGLPTPGAPEPPVTTLAGMRICRQVLQLVARYIAWFDVKTVANDRFMPVLLQFITAPAPRVVPLMACAAGGALPPPPSARAGARQPHPLRAAAVGVIRALLHKGMDDLQRLLLIRGGQTVEMLASVLGTPGAIAVAEGDNGLDGVEGGAAGPGDDVGSLEDSEEFGLEICRLLGSVGQALLAAGESCATVVQDPEACGWTAAALRAAVSMSMQILLQEDVQCATEVMPFLMAVIQAFARERRAAAAAEAAAVGGSGAGLAGAAAAGRTMSSPGMLGSPSPTMKGQSGTSPSLPPGASSTAFLAPAAGPSGAADRSAAGGPDGVAAAPSSSASSGNFALHLSSPPPPAARTRPRATSGVGDGSSSGSATSAACPGYEGRPAGVSFMEAMPRLLDIIAQRVAYPPDFQVNPPAQAAAAGGGGPGGQLSIVIPGSGGGDGEGEDDEEERIAILRLRDDLKRAFCLIVRTAPEACVAHLTTLDEAALAAAGVTAAAAASGGQLPIGAGGFLAPARLATLPSQPWNTAEAALSALYWIGDAAPNVMATIRAPGGGHLYQALATVFSCGLPEQVAPAAAAFNEAVAAARAAAGALPAPPTPHLRGAAAGPRLPPHLSLPAAAKVGGVTVPVLLQYYELAARFFPVLCAHAGSLQRMFEALVGPAGIAHPSPMIRSRCSYLLLKLVKAIATSDVHAEQMALGTHLPLLLYRLEPMLSILPPAVPASGWQATPVPTTGSLGVSGGLGHNDHQHIFETVGTLLAQSWIPVDKRPTFTQTVLGPLLRALEAGLTEVETRRAAAGGGAGSGAGGSGGGGVGAGSTSGVHPDIITWTARVLQSIGLCMKGFTRGSVEACPALLALIETAVGGAVKAVSVVPNEASIRQRAFTLLHKMVDVVATQPEVGRTLDFMGRVWPLLLSSAAPEDVGHVMLLANQIMSKYRNEAGAFTAAIFVPTVTRALQVLPPPIAPAAASTRGSAARSRGDGGGVVTPRSETRLLVSDEARARNDALKSIATFVGAVADTTPTLAARVLGDPVHCRPQMWELLSTVCRACMADLLVDLGPARTALSLLLALVRHWLPVTYPTAPAAGAAGASGGGGAGGGASGGGAASSAPAPGGPTPFPPPRARALGPGGTMAVTGPPAPQQSPLVSVAGDPSGPARFIQFLAEVALPLSWSVATFPAFDASDSQSLATAGDIIHFHAVAAVHIAAHTALGPGGAAPAVPLPGVGPSGMDAVAYLVSEVLPRPPFHAQPQAAATYGERLRRYIGVAMSIGATLPGVSAAGLLDPPLKDTRACLFALTAGFA